jgi:acyl-CoA thioester hydrolase
MFSLPIRIYYEDTDAAGVVYYANYLKFAERARSEWLRHLGINQQQMLQNEELGFVVASANIRYHKPARLDDLIYVDSHLQHLGKVRISMRQILRRDGETLATVEVEIVTVNRDFVPTRLPEALVSVMSQTINN